MAGGLGTRMNNEIPKQFLLYEGEPIIIKTLKRFLEAAPNIKIIVVLPQKHLSKWDDLKKHYTFLNNFEVATGGKSRTESVKFGLDKIVNKGLVAIHDAVRPFVTNETILASFQSAELYGSGVAVVKLKDSIRETDGNISKAKDRANYVIVQTPQTFNVDEIKLAYEKAGDHSFTDDATVYEVAGYSVNLVEGSYLNIKITTPEDLKLNRD